MALTASRSCRGRASKAWGDVYQHCEHVSDLAITHLLELEICSLVGHALVPWAKFTRWGSQCPVHVLRRIHLEVVDSQLLFALESQRGVNRIMRWMTCSGLSQLCLGECVAEVRVLGRHGIRQEDAYEQGYLTQSSTNRDECDVLRLEQDARRISRDVTTVAHVTVLSLALNLIFTQSKGARGV